MKLTMVKEIKAPAKRLWKLRYTDAKCDYGKLKRPTETGRVCKVKPGRPKK